jgi:hypothetical protein
VFESKVTFYKSSEEYKGEKIILKKYWHG